MAKLWAGLFGKKKEADVTTFSNEAKVEYQLEAILKDVLSIGRYLLRNKDTELLVEIGKDVPSVLSGDVEAIRKRFEGIINKAIEINHGDLVRISVSFKATEWKRGDVCFVVALENPKEEFSFTISQEVVNYLPFVEINELSDGTESAQFHVSDTKVLVVDDNATLLKMAKQMLTQFGCDVTCASSGEEALKKLKGDFYQIVFLDLMMPQMDGFEVASRIRAMGGEFRTIPIIALSGNAIVGSQGRCFEVGMDDYISKPMHMDKLAEMLRKYIKGNRIAGVKKSQVEKEEKALKIETTQDKERFLQRLVGFDVKQAVEYCMNDLGIFTSIVRSYYEDSMEERIEKAYLERDIYEYTIYVHALKSTSKSIGAMRLSEMAYQLELAGKRGDEQFIEENHVVFMDVYREHLKTIGEALAELREGESVPEEVVAKTITNAMAIDNFFDDLKEALSDMNPQKIDDAVANLGMVAFRNPECEHVLAIIRRQVENYDFMEARETLEELIALEKNR